MVARPAAQIPERIGQIAFDDAFPERPVEFVHDLHLNEPLTLASFAALADRLPRESVIYDTAAQPLLVPSGGPPRGALEQPGDVIRDLSSANAWLTLLNVEDDPGMAELMNTHLDRLEAGMIAKQGKMRNRVAFVFVSSPNSVTPVHFDIEHSLLMQISWEQERQHRVLRERRRSTARDRPVLGRLPRADRDSSAGGRRVHPDARPGGLHTPRHAALGA